MAVFRVRRYEAGIWDDIEPVNVEATNAKDAAEAVCGERLVAEGTPGDLRAEVWPSGSPSDRHTFYRK